MQIKPSSVVRCSPGRRRALHSMSERHEPPTDTLPIDPPRKEAPVREPSGQEARPEACLLLGLFLSEVDEFRARGPGRHQPLTS